MAPSSNPFLILFQCFSLYKINPCHLQLVVEYLKFHEKLRNLSETFHPLKLHIFKKLSAHMALTKFLIKKVCIESYFGFSCLFLRNRLAYTHYTR